MSVPEGGPGSGTGFLGSRDAAGRPQPETQTSPEPTASGSPSATRIALVYPELLGTYGDGGNALVLSQRLRWRGLDAEVVSVPAGEPVPTSCDIYLLGGGEDEPQVLAAEGMRRGSSLLRAVEGGAMVFAVCAGFQIVGETFLGADGKQHDGVGLLGLETRRTFGGAGEPTPPRAVGDIVVEPEPEFGLPLLLGYENHGGRTRPTPDAPGRRLGVVRKGIGNGTPDRAEGHVADVGQGRVLATYLHGPVLAQNPALADLLLRWVQPDLPELAGPAEAERLRSVRLRALDVA
ncbi:MAG TPA: glutamine amidotransferase [Frankiaceae bacterium]|nr:glutamine amidotransferase [Frankiaceae bacterium]